ncbi:uncharacterized protein PgNI_12018 [Pyricularia grisea]|uniref:Uncharacterized protein n=1 Tax=Pyricularia grisea TaxID=148305 RepID=A0A6P8AQC2_PYRGI|nr:uncharacterized protein PgNI_12018 [Pyricularia grisea]TLD04251.1 hypothetical protein PgNI_12018 [Pyricularia grisea]
MPWLSPLHSPAESPRIHTLTTPASPSPITYIPPLIDGACGTVPRAQKQSLSQSLSSDAFSLVKLLPELAFSAWEGLFTNDGAAIGDENAGSQWGRVADLVLQLAVSAVELNILFFATPMWLFLPGLFFAGWLLPMLCVVWGIARLLNTREPIYCQPRPAQPESVGRAPRSSIWSTHNSEGEDERWFFVSGMSLSPRTTKNTTLPLLARLFNRPITALLTRTYGVPLDLLLLPLARAMPALSPDTILYNTIRSALQDNKANKVVVLAHNTGAIQTSRVLSHLCADLPADKLSKLEVYTFGAAAAEFVLPLGDGRGAAESSGATTPALLSPGTGPHATAAASEAIARRPGPHIEHFAHARDPFARIGVLRSVREDLDGRFCGGVFVVNGPGPVLSGGSRGAGRAWGPYHHHVGAARPPSPLYLPALGVSSSSSSSAAAYKREVLDMTAAAAAPAPSKRAWLRRMLTTITPSTMPLVGRLASRIPSATPPPVVSLHDYLAALFPEQVATLANCDRASVLDSIMSIERDVAEKREFAAIASHASSTSLAAVQSFAAGGGVGKTSARDKRVSWTGLGATVNGVTGVGSGGNGGGGGGGANANNSSSSNNNGISSTHLDGIIGLEIARQGCRDCQGHRGREVSRLVRFVDVGVGMSGAVAAAAGGGGVGVIGPTGAGLSVVAVKDIPKGTSM